MDEFNTFEEFFAWYLEQITALVPDFMSMEYEQIHAALPPIPDDELNRVFEGIRKIIDFPRNIYLVYEPKIFTFFSWFNPEKKRLEVGVPTIAVFLLRFPPVMKVLIQHELGHLFNRDCFLKKVAGHNQCSNICQDVRINAQLNIDYLNQATKVIYGFKEPADKIGNTTPHPSTVYPEIGLPLDGAFDWTTIHDFYHLHDDDDKEQNEFMKKLQEILDGLPQIGDIIIQPTKGEEEEVPAKPEDEEKPPPEIERDKYRRNLVRDINKAIKTLESLKEVKKSELTESQVATIDKKIATLQSAKEKAENAT